MAKKTVYGTVLASDKDNDTTTTTKKTTTSNTTSSEDLAKANASISDASSSYNTALLKSTTPTETYTSTATTDTRASDYEKLRQAQQEAAIEAIKAQEKSQLAALTGAEEEISPLYAEQRGETTAASELAKKRFSEGIAGQGLTGVGAESEIRRSGALQRDISALNQAEAQALADIANQRATISSQAASDIAQAKMATQAQTIEDLINLANQQRSEELQTAQLTGMYQGQPTMAGQEYALNQLVSTSAADYQAQINNLLAQGYSEYSPEIQALRAARSQKIAAQQAAQQEVAQQEFENALALKEFNLSAQREGRLGASGDSSVGTSNLPSATSLVNAAISLAKSENIPYEEAYAIVSSPYSTASTIEPYFTASGGQTYTESEIAELERKLYRDLANLPS